MMRKSKVCLAALLAALLLVGMLPMGAGAEQVSQIQESFDTFTGITNSVPTYKNAFYMSGAGDRLDYCVDAVKGVYGKAAEDVSANIRAVERTEKQEAYCQYPAFVRASCGIDTPFEIGDQIRVSFQFALDRLEDFTNDVRFLKIRAKTASGVQNSDSTDGINRAVQITRNSISFLNVSNYTEVPVNWVPRKWYRVELVFVPGNGTDVKNKMSAWLDGEKIATDLEFDAKYKEAYSQLTGFGEVSFSYAIPQANHVMPGVANGQTGENFFVDEYEITHQRPNAESQEPALVSAVSVTSASANVMSTYKSAFLLKEDMTVAEFKDSLTVTGGRLDACYGTNGAVLDDSDSANGCYLRVTSESGTKYDYFVGQNFALYSEDFNSYQPVVNKEYKGFAAITLVDGMTTTGVSGFGSKDADDHSYVFKYDDYVYEKDSGKSFMKRESWNALKLSVLQPVTIEFSVASLDNETAGNLALEINGGGGGGFNAVQLLGGTIQTPAETGWGTIDSGVTYAPNEWHKIALEIDNVANKGTVYIDGVKKRENMRLSYTAGQPNFQTTPELNYFVFNMFVNQGTAGQTYSGGFAIDDLIVYAGTYNAAADMGTTTFGEAKLYRDGVEVTDTALSNGTYEARIPVQKDGIVNEQAAVILARYDDGRLVEILTKQAAFSRKDDTITSAPITVSDVTDTTTIRAFAWSSLDSLHPLHDSKAWGGK